MSLDSIFGPENTAIKFVAAFVLVLALIALTAWLVRRFGSNRLGSAARGRQPRLAVIDAANVDGRRRLVLIRRDNVEHLMMIGGPNDVVVEPNIVRASARDAREPTRDIRAPEPTARVPVTENGGAWPLQPSAEPPPVAPVAPRPLRSNLPEEPWVASEPPPPPAPPPAREVMREPPRPRADSLTGMAASEFTNKVNPEFDFTSLRPTPRAEAPAPVVPSPAPEPVVTPQTDRNLAEMAQRLEAALKRPGTSDFQPPVTDPLAASVKAEPKLEVPRPAPKPDAKPEMKAEPNAEPKPAAQKSPFDSLEQEMANLLGRQPGKS